MIPTWLQAHIRANRRTAALRICLRCGAPILTGLDADKAALTVRVDLIPIDILGETVALLNGRTTYDLVAIHDKKELHHRDQWQITAPRKYPVLAEHRCGRPLDAYAEKTVHEKKNREAPDDEPPF